MGFWAGKEGGLAREKNSKPEFYGCKAGLPSWSMPPRGYWIGQTSYPINELWASTNEDKGKDGQGRVTGKDGQGQEWAMTGKDNDGLGQLELDANSSR